jgi:SPX domain protein involved in polyphosphate accumulation
VNGLLVILEQTIEKRIYKPISKKHDTKKNQLTENKEDPFYKEIDCELKKVRQFLKHDPDVIKRLNKMRTSMEINKKKKLF